MLADRLELLPEIIESRQSPAPRTPPLAFHGVKKKPRLTSDLAHLGGVAVNEFRPELDGMRDPTIADGVKTSPDAVASFENAGANPPLLEQTHCRQPRDARADDGDVER